MYTIAKTRARLGTLNAARKAVKQLDDRSYFSFFKEVSRGLWRKRRRVRKAGLAAATKRAIENSALEELEWQPAPAAAAAAEDASSADYDAEPGGRTCDIGRCTKDAAVECKGCSRLRTAMCEEHAEAFVCEDCEYVAWCSYCSVRNSADGMCYACGARICPSCQEACPTDGDAPLCRACYRLIRLGK
jgi:hypothetical protein